MQGRVSTEAWSEVPRSLSYSSRGSAGLRRERAWVRLAIDAPRWLLLAGLVLAPWAYGGTRPAAKLLVGGVLIAAVVCWALERALRRRRLEVSPWLLGAAVGLLVLGWGMTWNARAYFDWDLGVLFPLNSKWGAAPGTVDGALSLLTMVSLSGVLGAMVMAADLCQRPQWRLRLWVTMVGTGVSVAMFGLVQKLGGREVMAWVWEADRIQLDNNFGLFRYRGNAGAYLNLVLPLTGTLLVWTFLRAASSFSKALWVGATFVLLAGIQFNPSRASWLVAGCLCGLMLALTIWHQWRHAGLMWDWKSGVLYFGGAALGILALAGIVLWGGWESSWHRLARAGLEISERAPFAVCRTMAVDAGWAGYGPGTFRAIFPSYQMSQMFADQGYPESWKNGFWEHAHNDYLQVVIEWGWLGGLLWAFLVAGGLCCGIGFVRKKRSWDRSADWLALGCLVGVLGVLAHAAGDFPLQVPAIQLYAAVLVGICWGMPRLRSRERTANQIEGRAAKRG